MSNPRLNLVVGGETALGGDEQPAAAVPGGPVHVHIHLDRGADVLTAQEVMEGRPRKRRGRPVLIGLGAAALAAASFYAGQHNRTLEARVAAAAPASAPATRLPFGAAAPRLPGVADDGLPPALRAQLAAPPTVIPPPGAPPNAPASAGTSRGKSSFGLGD